MGVGGYYERKEQFLKANPGGIFPGSYADTCQQNARVETAKYRKEIDALKKQLSVNPNPTNWKIEKVERAGNYTIIELSYPDCTNYDGRKLMVYEAELVQLMNQKSLDPHFQNKKDYLSPIARFEPTARGWALARQLCLHGR